MAIDLSSEDARLIRGFIPINTLPGFQFDELCASHHASSAKDGDHLFAQDSADTDYYFLLEGSVTLEAGQTEVDTVKAETEAARFALAHHIPRKVTCIAQGPIRYLKVDSEMFSQETVSQLLQQHDMVGSESELVNEEAIPFLLKSPLFRQLFVSVLPGVSACLEKTSFEAGQTVIEQGKQNNTFYIIQEGRCKVTHRPFENAKEIQLEDLQQGDTFGEYALLIDGSADVTVTTSTDCEMYTIDEKHFDQCIKQPLMREISWSNADTSGDVFLDIQQLDDYRKTHVKGSINYPFSTLRIRMGQLADTDKYIVVSNDDKLSMAAVVMLRQQQLDAVLLVGGLNAAPEGSLDHILMPESEDSRIASADDESEVVELESEQLSVQHSVMIGSPIISATESENQATGTQAAEIESQSVLIEAANKIGSANNGATAADDNESLVTKEHSYDANLHIKKLEGKLEEVWKAYKKTRTQLHRSKRKYSACSRQYTRIEQNYHSLLARPETADESQPAISSAITADDINERLREEFTQQVETNLKLKQQIIILKKKLEESKQAQKSSAHTSTKELRNQGTESGALIDTESLLLQIQELEQTIQHLEQKKTSQQNKAKQYVSENNKLRQLIQELAKQAIDEQAQDHVLSSFDFSTEFASSNNAYDADVQLDDQMLEQALVNVKKMNEATEHSINSTDQDAVTKHDQGLGNRLKGLFATKGKKAQTITWIGIISTALLTALVVALFVNTKEGQLLLQQIGF